MNEKELEDLISMFETDGWRIFIRTAKELEEETIRGAVDIAQTGDQWQYVRGQIHQLRSVIGYENLCRANYEQITEDNNAEVI